MFEALRTRLLFSEYSRPQKNYIPFCGEHEEIIFAYRWIKNNIRSKTKNKKKLPKRLPLHRSGVYFRFP